MSNFKHGAEIFKKLNVVNGLTDEQRTLIAARLDFREMNEKELNEVKTDPSLSNISEETWSIIVDLSICDENLIL